MKENIKKITEEIKANFEDILSSTNDENIIELKEHIKQEIEKEIEEYEDELISIVESECKKFDYYSQGGNKNSKDMFVKKYINMPDDIRYLFRLYCLLGPVLSNYYDALFADEFYRTYRLSYLLSD